MNTFLLGAVMYGAIVVFPIFGEVIFGKTALQRGKLLLPFGTRGRWNSQWKTDKKV